MRGAALIAAFGLCSAGAAAAVKLPAGTPCYAAAARDPLNPCSNPDLLYAAVPSPSEAVLMPNSPCRPVRVRRGAVLRPCEFGVSDERRTATVALLGDSHAASWRATLEVVAQAKRWRGFSITRSACPFSTHIRTRPQYGPVGCRRLHRETIAWLREHRWVTTIFVSSWALPHIGPTTAYGGDAAAFGAMLDRVPRSVRRIYVLRDNPVTSEDAPACVDAARDRHLPLADVCPVRRSGALTPDPLAVAARSRRPRVRVVDLTRFFCGPRYCMPVIGGAYVYKDDNHMNAVYATSLGPFVLRAITGDQAR